MDTRKSAVHVSAVVVLALALGAYLGAAQTSAGGPDVRALSGRADMVSGGDALIEIMPARAADERFVITIDGRDVTPTFKPTVPGGALVGLVTNLRVGANELEVSVDGQRATKRLTLVNHPVEGPIFSGPHQQPFACETEAMGLGRPQDEHCRISTRVEYFYRSTGPADARGSFFRPYDPGARPADVAMTLTSDDRRVPYIVRREIGTINRAVYVIAFLHEPGTPLPTPWSAASTWNQRLIYSFGSGCGTGYHQGQPSFNAARAYLEENTLGDYALARGYALATSSLNAFGTTCNDVISAETMMMVKEHFIEMFGAPRYTIGNGTSGGSMAQHHIANNNPGLLDGIMPGRSFPDTMTFLQPLLDCALLTHAFAESPLPWTPEQKQAVAGHRSWEYCQKNGSSFPLLNPGACDRSVPEPVRFAPANPGGVRCTYQDNQRNVYGRDPATGFARRPFDNTGVQYGFAALKAGRISFDQFVDLNRRVGGFDINGRITAGRMIGDSQALAIAYRTGRLTQGAALSGIPIIDVRNYMDPLDDIHDAVPTQVMRARLMATNGNIGNHVSLTAASLGGTQRDIVDGTPFRTAVHQALDALTVWLDAIAADRSQRSAAEKTRAHRPATLVDACYTTDGQKITDGARCRQLFPTAMNPRLAAEEPMTLDRFKCELKPVSAADYSPRLNDAQVATLKAVFPDGVCDYSRKGAGHAASQTWLSYSTPSATASSR